MDAKSAEYEISNAWIWVGSAIPIMGMAKVMSLSPQARHDVVAWLLFFGIVSPLPLIAAFYRGKVVVSDDEVRICRRFAWMEWDTRLPISRLEAVELSGRGNGRSVNLKLKGGKVVGLYLAVSAGDLFYKSLEAKLKSMDGWNSDAT